MAAVLSRSASSAESRPLDRVTLALACVFFVLPWLLILVALVALQGNFWVIAGSLFLFSIGILVAAASDN